MKEHGEDLRGSHSQWSSACGCDQRSRNTHTQPALRRQKRSKHRKYQLYSVWTHIWQKKEKKEKKKNRFFLNPSSQVKSTCQKYMYKHIIESNVGLSSYTTSVVLPKTSFSNVVVKAQYIIIRYILFETRTGDEKDDNNSLRRFGVLHLLQREE